MKWYNAKCVQNVVCMLARMVSGMLSQNCKLCTELTLLHDKPFILYCKRMNELRNMCVKDFSCKLDHLSGLQIKGGTS